MAKMLLLILYNYIKISHEETIFFIEKLYEISNSITIFFIYEIILLREMTFLVQMRKTYGAGASSNYQFGRWTNARHYFAAALYHGLTDENGLVTVIIPYPKGMIGETPCHVFVIRGWDERLILFYC